MSFIILSVARRIASPLTDTGSSSVLVPWGSQHLDDVIMDAVKPVLFLTDLRLSPSQQFMFKSQQEEVKHRRSPPPPPPPQFLPSAFDNTEQHKLSSCLCIQGGSYILATVTLEDFFFCLWRRLLYLWLEQSSALRHPHYNSDLQSVRITSSVQTDFGELTAGLSRISSCLKNKTARLYTQRSLNNSSPSASQRNIWTLNFLWSPNDEMCHVWRIKYPWNSRYEMLQRCSGGPLAFTPMLQKIHPESIFPGRGQKLRQLHGACRAKQEVRQWQWQSIWSIFKINPVQTQQDKHEQ